MTLLTILQLRISKKVAKNLLWEIDNQTVLPAKINMQSCEKLMEDIIDPLTGLDAENKLPRIAVDPLGLNRIPKIKPVESLSVSICERVRLLQPKLQSVDIELSVNVTRIIKLEGKVNAPTTYASLAASNIT